MLCLKFYLAQQSTDMNDADDDDNRQFMIDCMGPF